MAHNLVHRYKPGDLATCSEEELFITDVVICADGDAHRDLYISNVHREALRLLCGDEDVALLEAYRRMGQLAWLVTGGATDTCSMELHQIVKFLPV